MQGWDDAQAGFIVREHGRHPRLAGQGAWRECGRTETGQVREQRIEVAEAPWRRIELTGDTPTEAGERAIRLWSNLPEQWRSSNSDPAALADRLLQPARNIDPRQVATSKRRLKVAEPKRYIEGAVVLAQARAATPPKGCRLEVA